MSGLEDLLILSKTEEPTEAWEWATVTQLSPLRVRFDGEADSITVAPVNTAGSFVVGDRVWCQVHNRQFIVISRSGGPLVAQDPTFDAEVTAPSFVASGDFTGAESWMNSYRFNGNSMKMEGASGGDYIGFLTSAGAAGRIKTGGVTIGSSYANDNAPTNGLLVKGQSNLDGDLYSVGVYNATSTFSANVGIATSPTAKFYRLTSSKRYKVAIQPEDVSDEAILALQPKSYVDKAQFIELQGKPEQANLPRHLGLIAEDVAEIPGLKDILVNYSTIEKLGRVPDAIAYDRVVVALIPVVQRLLNRVAELEQRLGITP